jgi:hypothetical protein
MMFWVLDKVLDLKKKPNRTIHHNRIAPGHGHEPRFSYEPTPTITLAHTKQMHRASKRISRSQLVTASEKFTNACIGLTETDATVIQLIHFFERSNRFYCRFGDGTQAAKSCLQSIHANDDTKDAEGRFGDGTQATKSCLQSIHANDDTKDAEEPRTTCTRKQLTAYFLKTISFDPKRIGKRCLSQGQTPIVEHPSNLFVLFQLFACPLNRTYGTSPEPNVKGPT